MQRVPCNRFVVFGLVALGGCAADLWTKHWIFSWKSLTWGEIYWIWDGHAGFQKSLNEGALFGMGQGLVWLFAAMSVLAALAIPIWLFWFRAAHDMWLTVALGAVMGGVFGNLYDRIGMHGLRWPIPHPRAGEPVYAVRDWILLQWNDDWTWPNFNVADSLLVVGVCLLLLHACCFAEDKSSAQNRNERQLSEPANCSV